jgi:hypothetical protein
MDGGPPGGCEGPRPQAGVRATPGSAIAYRSLDSQWLATLGAATITEYPTAYLVVVPDGLVPQFVSRARAEGIGASPQPDYDRIRLNGYDFSSFGPEPVLPPDLALSDYRGLGLYLVQTPGPNRAEWESALRTVGEPILYYPENTYLVRAEPARVWALRGSPAFQYVGVYQPAFKIRPDILVAEGPVPATVQLDGGRDLTGVTAIIEALAGRKVEFEESGPIRNVTLTLTANDAKTLAFLPEVVYIEGLSPGSPSDERQALVVAGRHNGTQPTNPTTYDDWLALKGFCTYASHPPGCYNYWTKVAVYDSGLDVNRCLSEGSECTGGTTDRHPDLGSREKRFFCATSGSTNYCLEAGTYVYSDLCYRSHGTGVSSVIAGDPVAGVEALGANARDSNQYYLGAGIAPLSEVVTFRIWNDSCVNFGSSFYSASNFESWSQRLVQALGTTTVRFANHSWNNNEGEDRTYNAFSQKFDQLVRDADGGFNQFDRPQTVVFAAGNTVSSIQVLAPATAKNVVSVGASESYRPTDVAPWASGCNTGTAASIKNIAYFSRRQYQSEAARFKPDLVAAGSRIGMAFSRRRVSEPILECDPTYSDPNARYYDREAGTSFAAPVVAGAAILAETWYHNRTGILYPSPALLKAMLVAHADDLHGGTDKVTSTTLPHRPSVAQGFGRPNLDKLFQTTVGVRYFDEDHTAGGTRRFIPGEASWSQNLVVADATKDVVVALVYTDRYAAIGAASLNVNQLDVKVWDGGAYYLGNTLDTSGYSLRLDVGLAGDTHNTVELIRIRPGEIVGGDFTLDVVPISISGRAVPGLDGLSSNQDFAVYIYNAQ